MASKQLGKLRQWAGEKISTREKTQPSSEFVDLEKEMETRKNGLDRMYNATRVYLEYISQKQPSELISGDPMMQSEVLGMVMIEHGEELGDASALGRSLAIFGRARCKTAAIQNIYAVTLNESFLAYLERSKAKLEGYVAQRKKLESRRLAYDAAITRADKVYKKEKDKKEAEEELARAKARYEETAEDVRTKMDSIREGEVEAQRELRIFLQTEIGFLEQYLDVLREVSLEWPEPDTYADLRKPSSSLPVPHNFSRTSTRSTESKDSDDQQAPSVSSRYGSTRSVRSTSSKKGNHTRDADQHESSSESEYDTANSRAPSRLSRKSSAKSLRKSTRPRSKSVATIGDTTTDTAADETTSVKNNGKHKKAYSGGVANWVGDAVSSVMSRNKSRNPDVVNFAELRDGEERTSRMRKSSMKSLRSANGRSRSRTRDNPKNTRKIVKAIYDFSGSGDELSFKTGEEIVVVSEVLDDWWLGETGGRKGIFPRNYVALVKVVDAPAPMKSKNPSMTSILGFVRSGKLSPEDVESRRTLVEPSESELSITDDERDADSIDDWQPSSSDDRHNTQPSGLVVSAPSGEEAAADTFRSREPTVREDEFNKKLSVTLENLNLRSEQDLQRTHSPMIDIQPSSSPIKRMPPPPPPRRINSNVSALAPPPLPYRHVAPGRTQSSSMPLHNLGPPTLPPRAHSDTSSPFESQSELSFETVAKTRVTGAATLSCSLQVKKKGELKDICQSLGINDGGTREELQQRIRKHLDDHSSELENDPTFSGLYTTRSVRRQRSVQPSNVSPHGDQVAEPPKFTSIPEEGTLTPPTEDLGDVSTMIPESSQTPVESPRSSPRKKPTSTGTAVPSQPSSPAKTVASYAAERSEGEAVQQVTHNFSERLSQTVSFLRILLSSSQNIYYVSMLLDFLGILYQIHINSVFPIPAIRVSAEPALSTTALATLYWALPSVVIPAIVSYFVSFASPSSRPRFDILSASIIRFAANVPDFYPSMVLVEKKELVRSLDVLGFKWRAVSSGITLAFAFAEAIVKRNKET
ncbi:hypothetical protein ACEPAG_9445 [Sanghuangporus baumii]